MLQACRLLFTACLFNFTACRLQFFPTLGPGLSVSLYGLPVTIFPDSRTQSVKVTDWPVNFTGLSGTVIDRPAKVTDCTVTLPSQSVSHHVQSGSLYLGQAGYLFQTGLFD